MSIQELAYWEYIISLILVFTLKTVCFTLAYLTVRLGHDLIGSGVRGDFKFSARFAGARADLASVSPGLLFVLLGIGLAAFAIQVPKPVRQEIKVTTTESLSGTAESMPEPDKSDEPNFRKEGKR
jgi:hypothetical protein